MKLANKYFIYIVVLILVYVVVNISLIKFQYIPGMITFIFWGFLAPLLAIVATWVILKNILLNKRLWITVSSIISVFFICCGLFSIYFIGSIWARI